MNIKVIGIIIIHAFVGWLLCDLTMVIGMVITSLDNAIIIHAIGAPIFFGAVSFIYFKKFGFTSPFQTAIIFVSFVIAMDFFIVALLIEQSFEMFYSPLGTWIPFTLIFTSTYLVGLFRKKNS